MKFPKEIQLDVMDCGPACLKMITNYYGKQISLDFLRGITYKAKDGVSLYAISDAAENIDAITITEISANRLREEGRAINIVDNNLNEISKISDNVISLVKRGNILNIYEYSKAILRKSSRINIVLEDINLWTDIDLQLYEKQLDKLNELIYESYKADWPIEVNVLTDIMYLTKNEDCGAGVFSLALAPNGKFYHCPAFYFDDPTSDIGSIDEGINIKNANLLELDYAPICSECDARHCKRCKF
jgi:CXXX repeat peptide maturase